MSKTAMPSTSSSPFNRYALQGDTTTTGDLRREAFETEVSARWFTPQLDRKLMKQLMKRSDAESLWNYGLWVVLMVASGAAGFYTWGTWWALPCFLVYGVLYSTGDHRAHELSHGTPFKTRWLNEALYHVCGFMTLHEGHYWRWSHTRHHTHTIIVGKDPEIAFPRPVSRLHAALDFFNLHAGPIQIRNICMQALGRITPDGEHFIPETERGKVVNSARIFVLVFVAVIAVCWYFHSILPAMYIVLPRFYGGFLAQFFNITQHAGLAEDVYDHRLNTRTFTTNPVFQWLYSNMNYHIEHHMHPMVPWHQLPKLHEAIKNQCPPVYTSVWQAWAEVLPAINQQAKDPSFQVDRALPETVQV
jgi:fatty acid desaturase